MTNSRSTLCIAASATLLALSSLAYAQTPPAAPAAAPAIPAVPPVPAPTCEQPGDLPSARPGQNTMANFQKKVDAYGTCMKAYVAEQRDAADLARATANAKVDAANGAVKTYNDYIAKLNEQQEKANR